ncbi:MAG: uroporphyrinogen-III C-methyltransferase [Zoogloeaceae bacterium]|jgi:uroporphyrin-3 C-methyltransferase|nr:uroporphyrinogen-III C-methyltransferase [Zoogloeaceae bacterium]
MNTEQPPFSMPALPALPLPRQGKRHPFWRNHWFWLALILFACVFWQWRESRSLIQETRQETAQRLAESERAQRENQTRIDKGLQEVAEIKRGQATLDTRLGEMEERSAALHGLYQEATLSHDEALLTEIEQHIQAAQQRLQLTGNVEAAILALQAADHRLQNKAARFLPLRRALTNDLGRLRATPFVDIAGMSLKLESVITEIDRMPLILDIVPEKAAQKPVAKEAEVTDSDENPARWQDKWRGMLADVWQEFRGLVRIQRLDRQLPELVSPEQGFILRENLKLRLLNARLALLMRDSWTYKNELVAAEKRLAHYFNPDAKTTQAARATLSQLAGVDINVTMPTLNESAAAARQLRHNREAR